MCSKKTLQDLIGYNTVDNFLVICEHDSFKRKILRDLGETKKLQIFDYNGRKAKFSFLKIFFKYRLKKTVVISEYFNLIPRITSLVTNSESISVIYGIISKKKLRPLRSKIWLLNTIFHPLYAKKYIVINRINTFNTISKNFFNSQVDFVKLDRKIKNTKTGNYALWISQCWEEDNLHALESFQQKCISELNQKISLIVVSHPRDDTKKYINFKKTLQSLEETMGFMELNGKPKTVFGIASSALLELWDYKLNVIRLENEQSKYFIDEEEEILLIPSMIFEKLKRYTP